MSDTVVNTRGKTTTISYLNYRSKTEDATLRRLYESIDCARLFNTRYLLDYSSVNLKGAKGRLALSIACRIQDEKKKVRRILFDWLLRQGCDFNLPDEDGMTVISWLCKHEKVDLFEFLLKKYKMEIKYDVIDINTDSTLTHAVRTGNHELVTLLLEVLVQFGIDVDNRNNEGLTPYGVAMRLNFPRIAELLKTVGKASTNVTIEPYWAVRTTNCVTNFKEVLVASIQKEDEPIRQRHIEHVSLKGPTKYTIIKTLEKEQIKKDKKDNKGLIMIEPPKCKRNRPRRKGFKKKTKNQSSTVENKKEECNEIKKVTFINEAEEKEEKLERKESTTITTVVSSNSSTSHLKRNNEELFPESPNMIEESGSVISRPVSSTSVRKSGRKISSKPIKLVTTARKKMSMAQFPTSPTSSLAESFDFDFLQYQNRMDQLMQYRKKQPKADLKITYADLRDYYPSNGGISSASSSTDNIRWLLTLKAEQSINPLVKHLSRKDIKRCESSLSNNSHNVVRRKSAIVSDIPQFNGRRRSTLYNSAFNRILSAS